MNSSPTAWYEEHVLILTKTYPVPSAKFRETSCIAGVNDQGQLRRVFPVPFRLLEEKSQFKRWQWIRIRMRKAPADHRPESYQIDFDSINDAGGIIPTVNAWEQRRAWYEPHLVNNFDDLEQRRQQTGETLGVLRTKRLIGLEINAEKNPDWTEEEKQKLVQDRLFDPEEVTKRVPLQKIPFAFYYSYECDGPNGTATHRHKVTDWEVGQLYRNCVRLYGADWEGKFRQKIEVEFAKKDLSFLMGTIHRFPQQWLIVGLFYPPVVPPKLPVPQQPLSLFE